MHADVCIMQHCMNKDCVCVGDVVARFVFIL